MSKNMTIGDGLDSLGGAIFLCVLLWFIFKVGAGIIHSDHNSYTAEQARCASMSGYYGGGRCYVNGEEK